MKNRVAHKPLKPSFADDEHPKSLFAAVERGNRVQRYTI